MQMVSASAASPRSCKAVMKAVASASLVGRRCGDGFREDLFSSKKGQRLNPLKSLNPKRQIQAVNRQERAI
jgi:hypothetical protein